MSALTWKEIDKCQSARQVYELLKAHGIKGVRSNTRHCPLAVATGWAVRHNWAWKPQSADVWHYKQIRMLSIAQRAFLDDFDNYGRFEDLVGGDPYGGDS